MNDELSRPVLRSADLIGCRYRLSLDIQAGRTYLQEAATASSGSRCASGHGPASRRLPTALASIPGLYWVAPGPDAQLDTLEALARGENVIAGAVLAHQRPGGSGVYAGIDEVCTPDLLVKIDDAPSSPSPTYMPVLVVTRHLLSSPRPAKKQGRPSAHAIAESVRARLLSVERLGRDGVLGRTVRDALVDVTDRKLRHHGPDAVALGQAAALLHRLGVSSGLVGAISASGMGLDTRNIVVATEGSRVASYRMALRDARDAVAATLHRQAQPPTRWQVGQWPLAPRRIRECKSCRYQDECMGELARADDISLLLPGDKSQVLRESGIDTVTALARADESTPGAGAEQRWLARARIAGVEALRKVARTSAPRADVEMDIDMEAYPTDGAYLWGTWVPGEDYRGFVTWQEPGEDGLGGEAEAKNFALFWEYLRERREAAAAEGKSFRAYCWAAEGENYWLRKTAVRFGGREFADEETNSIVAVPTKQEVDEFIGSDQWVDMLKVTRRQILSPVGMGLKVVAPWAGFHWRDADVDGEASLDLYRIATGTDLEYVSEPAFAGLSAEDARAMLLRYNGDDCRSVAHVRDWLDSGRATAEVPHGEDLPIP
nr:TM0106 family RecB-like putative nuclease [Corynebacterium lactis]